MTSKSQTTLNSTKFDYQNKNIDAIVNVADSVQNLAADEFKPNESQYNSEDNSDEIIPESEEDYDLDEDEDDVDEDEDEIENNAVSHESNEITHDELNDSQEQREPISTTVTSKKVNRSFMSTFNRINKSFSSFFRRFFQNKVTFGLFVLAVTVVLLIGAGILFYKCANRNSAKKGFSIYYDDYDEDDNDYDDDEHLTDSDTEIIRKKSPETYAKVNIASIMTHHKNENSFGYAKLNESLNDSSSSKCLFIKCDTNCNASFDSGISYLSDEQKQQQYATNAMNIKTNPFNFI